MMAKFIARRGEGIHHICLGVVNIEETVRLLEARGVKFIDKKPRKSQDQWMIAFINPKSTNWVLIELEETVEGDHNLLKDPKGFEVHSRA